MSWPSPAQGTDSTGGTTEARCPPQGASQTEEGWTRRKLCSSVRLSALLDKPVRLRASRSPRSTGAIGAKRKVSGVPTFD